MTHHRKHATVPQSGTTGPTTATQQPSPRVTRAITPSWPLLKPFGSVPTRNGRAQENRPGTAFSSGWKRSKN